LYGTGVPIRFSAAGAALDEPAPALGEHNAEVYGELLGLTPTEVDDLHARGVL
jgi:crotonobetainyl-CoA:carnitine CoA-transferase CaiB-like acyl-CoA transferase